MSVPFNSVKCSECDYSSWLLDRSGWKYYLLPERRRLTVDTAWGWCYDCRSLRAIEHFPASSLIRERLKKEMTALADFNKTGQLNRFFRLLGKDRFQIEQLTEQITVSENWLQFLEQRKSPPRCLSCSGSDIQCLELPVTEDYKGVMISDFKHPECGGRLWLRQNDFSINTGYTPRCYDMEGIYIDDVAE